MVIKAKGYIRNEFVAKSLDSCILQEESPPGIKFHRPKIYLCCGGTVVARLKTDC